MTGIRKTAERSDGKSKQLRRQRWLVFNGLSGVLVGLYCLYFGVAYSHSITTNHPFTEESLQAFSARLVRDYENGEITMEDAMVPVMHIIRNRTEFIRETAPNLALAFIFLIWFSSITLILAIKGWKDARKVEGLGITPKAPINTGREVANERVGQ